MKLRVTPLSGLNRRIFIFIVLKPVQDTEREHRSEKRTVRKD
jgi:hypothetical protein